MAIMDGLTVDQYQVTVHTLRTMAANLETAGRWEVQPIRVPARRRT